MRMFDVDMYFYVIADDVFSFTDNKAGISSSKSYVDHDHKPHLTPVFAGLLTVSILGFTIFYLFEVVWAIIFAGVKGRGVLRWVELGCGIILVLGGIMTVAWLRVST